VNQYRLKCSTMSMYHVCESSTKLSNWAPYKSLQMMHSSMKHFRANICHDIKDLYVTFNWVCIGVSLHLSTLFIKPFWDLPIQDSSSLSEEGVIDTHPASGGHISKQLEHFWQKSWLQTHKCHHFYGCI
jgi:hypothetical protein